LAATLKDVPPCWEGFAVAERPDPEAADPIRASLHELAEVLRHADHLEPETQEALADLMDELSKTVQPSAAPLAETVQLARSAAQLVRALQEQPGTTLLSAAKRRFDEAAARAEARAPMATGLARRLLDTLADLGI
jgi:hypothetical protein